MNPSGFYVDPVYDVLAAIKKIKTFLKNALVFDMEFYSGLRHFTYTYA